MTSIIVVGGGAAGFFAALSAKEHHPGARVLLLEKGTRPLDKVRISGGGRCNVTHDCLELRRLAAHYPRGERFLRKAFRHFAVADTIAWFRDRGVELKTEPDGRMFPITDDSATIVEALTDEDVATTLTVPSNLLSAVSRTGPVWKWCCVVRSPRWSAPARSGR